MSKNGLRSGFIITLIALLLTACAGSGGNKEASTVNSGSNEPGSVNETGAEEFKPVTLTYLSAWNGGGGAFPQDQENNPVAQKIREKPGSL